MAKKIIVAGGGHGGIGCAALLAEAGFDVTVYERHSRENMGYDWTDIFNSKSFSEIGVDMPDESKLLPMHNMSFCSPSAKMILRNNIDEARGSDIKMERKEIYNVIIDKAEKAGVKFEYETEIISPVMAGDRVIGIKTDKGDILGDLVIDACGCESPIRSQLPECCGIEKNMKELEKFYVYRAFYNRADTNEVLDKYKVYMLPKGVFGIAWVADDEDYSDILIGSFSPLTKEEALERAEYFRAENPVLGTELLRGGEMVTIPVRQTLAVMVADGYAAIGDSAFMTVPIIGSGIANSFRAAKILADTIIKDKTETYSAETLWDYEYNYQTKIGFPLSSMALVKLMLGKIKPEQLDYMFESRIITINELSVSDEGGGLIDINAELINKGKAMIKDRNLTGHFLSLAKSMAILAAVNKQLPKHYGRYAVKQWADKYNAIFK
ncbi:MAG: FAD-dependent monooxygenase [Eubacterium sp.]|nr:FAD-dependent monooxygenase [Eubacterium sp.]